MCRKTGCRWCAVPAAYGPPATIYDRFNYWLQRGIRQRLFEAIAATDKALPELSIDSMYVKAHRSAANVKRGTERGGRALARWPHLEDLSLGRS